LVEDNEDSRVILGEILEHAGHTVYQAANGREGVEAAVRLRPDVAVLDVGLPELDGYEAASEIRARVGSQMLLVALTGYGSEEDRQRAMDAGFDIHLRKPIDLRKLEAILEDVERKGDRR
jgi:CheY-like chemotaxis protein